MSNDLSQRVGEILGRSVFVSLEGGSLGVVDLTNMQHLLLTSKLPKIVTPEWIVAAIDRKQRASAEVKARREAAVAEMKAFMKAKGIPADGLNVYFTSTGFSVDNFFRNGIEEARRIITEAGIPFKRLEYSREHYVVRVIL